MSTVYRRWATASEQRAVPHLPASSALSRFTVLDLTRVRAGPTCVRQLADWGANVIKIEQPDSGLGGDAPGGPRAGPDFQNLHRNKRSLTLNLKAAAGREILLEMVERADVVVENYRPDVKARLQIGYEVLKAVNPGIVLASISGFGQDGPYAGRPGFDQIAQGMGGLMSITGLPGQGPVRVGIPIADLCAGLFAAQGILIALLEREVSGQGQWIQTSLLQAQVFMLDFQAARWLVDHDVPKQAGNNHPTSIPTGVFATADGHINVAVAGQEIWRRFCRAIGHEELIENAAYATPADRLSNRDTLNGELQEILRHQSSGHWIELLNAAGVPCGPINTIDQVFADPQVRHLGLAQPVQSHERGDIELVGQPIIMSRTASCIRTPPPLMGEHVDELLHELGYDDVRIAELREAKTI
jgi:crotonobetainyl-CoA:carnitine CoA-transferase CaiB-like acyl-CoA transferase